MSGGALNYVQGELSSAADSLKSAVEDNTRYIKLRGEEGTLSKDAASDIMKMLQLTDEIGQVITASIGVLNPVDFLLSGDTGRDKAYANIVQNKATVQEAIKRLQATLDYFEKRKR